MALDASLDAALQGAAPLVCLLLKAELPDHTTRILDGAAEVTFGAESYTGEDSVYGTLDGIETMTEQVGTEAPLIRLTFLPATLTALADLTNPANQGSPVTIWFAALSPSTGLLIGEPEMLFFGELDTADADVNSSSTVISMNAASAWERLFDANEGQRLNNAFIQSIYPGALGAAFVISIQRDLPWGYDAPRPRVVSDVNTNPPANGGYYDGTPGSGCAAPETPFQIAPDDTAPAGQITVGAAAWTRHHETGVWGLHTVLAAVRLENRERWRVEFEDGREPFIATPDHLFETGDFEPVTWTRLDDLKPGSVISGMRPGAVRSTGFHDHGPVMRFTVEEAAAYVSAGLQSHNKRDTGL